MAHPYLGQIQEIVSNIDLGDSDIECKHFFSGAAVYANGKIVASLSPKGLAFKLTEARCAEVLSEGLAISLRYFEKSPVKRGYVLFPDKDQLRKGEIEGFFQECVFNSTQDVR
jgi:TfoX/Sxy family transcriptional regulator of competence genes